MRGTKIGSALLNRRLMDTLDFRVFNMKI